MSTQELRIQRARYETNRRWWMIAGLLGIIITLNQNRHIQEFWPLLAMIGLGAVYNFILSILAHYKQVSRFWPYAELAMDWILVSGLVHLTGGFAASPLFFLFPLVILLQAFNYDPRQTLISGAGLFAAGLGLTLLEAQPRAVLWPLVDRFLIIAATTGVLFALVRKLKRECDGMLTKVAAGECQIAEMVQSNERLQHKISTSTQQLEDANMMLVKKNLAMMALHEIYVAMSSTFHSGKLLNLVIDTAMTLLRASSGCLMLVDQVTKTLRIKVARGLDPKCVRDLEIQLGESVEGKVALNGQDQSFTQDKVPPGEAWAIAPDSKSKMCVPLYIKKKIVGTITVESSRENAFSKGDLDLFSTLGSQASEVLQSIEIYEEMRNKADSLSLLFEVQKSIGNIFNLRRLFDTILERALMVMKARRGFLMIYDKHNETLAIRAALGLSETLTRSTIKVDRGIAGWVFQNVRPVLIPEVDKSPLFDSENDHIYAGKTLLACPLHIRKKVFGVICINDRLGGKHFSRDDLKLLGALASQAAIAIENVELYASIRRDYLNAIKALAAAVDAKDHYTHGHSHKVMVFSARIARELNLSAKEIERIKYGALLHDAGKIGISEAVLNKPSRLTPKEFDTIAMHPILGVSIVQNIESLKELIPIILYHHERYAGGGYPEGKSGNSIPLGARIVAVADAWDVMTSDRAYRKALPRDVAVAELIKCSGTQFDPEIVEAHMRALEKEKNEKMETLEEEKPDMIWDEEELSRLME